MTRTTAELRQYLAGEWLFDNDFKDTSGNGNDGTPTDIEWKPTLRGMKPKLNGSSSVVNCGNDSSLDITDEITLSMWIKMYNFTTDQPLIWRLDSWRANGYYLVVYNSDKKIRFITGLSATDVITTSTFNADGWHHIVATQNGTAKKIYVDGVLEHSITGTNIASVTTDIIFGKAGPTSPYTNELVDNTKIYNTTLTATEVLNLYNETKGEYGVMPAEHSFTHNPDDVIDASDAVGAWGTAKESTTELSDLSGNGNIADIHGAMPTEGFIQGRRFDGVDDNLGCGTNGNLNITEKIHICSVIIPKSFSITRALFTTGSGKYQLLRLQTDGKILFRIWDNSDTIQDLTTTAQLDISKTYVIDAMYFDGVMYIYINGTLSKTKSVSSGDMIIQTGNTKYIGTLLPANNPYDGIINYTEVNTQIMESQFNTFARLPFWAVNYTDYPDNVTEYTDNLPYSSSIISSGIFKVDDDKLQCVSAGTMTYSASYEFDGSEYIKVEIDGVEYAGTGTITQGNTTVSVAQGSNKITIQVGTGDTIDEININFRKEV